jgi:ABC-type uncharacterized transport system substrate-binding protein
MKRPLLLLCAVSALGAATAANAHPHVWVSARTTILFDKDGKAIGLKHDWTFDEMYSAFATQGLGKDGKPPTREELQPLAKTNMDSLVEFDYFTFAKLAGKKLEFDEPKDFWLEADDKKLVSLHFTLPLKTPEAVKTPFSFQVYDPTYFVAFGFEKNNPISLSGAPQGCSQSIVEPAPLLANEAKKLGEAKTENFSPGADLSMKLAPRVVVACP